MKDPNKNSYLKGLLKRLTVMPNSDLVKAGKYISDYIEKQYKEFALLEAEYLKLQKDLEEHKKKVENEYKKEAEKILEEYKKKAEKTPAKRKTTKKPQ